MKRFALLSVLLLLSVNFLFSVDFGLLLDEKIEAENELFTSTTGLTPWFSWDGGKGLSVYFSGLLSLRYSKSDDNIDNDGLDKPAVLPELSRFALNYRVNQSMFLEAGRVFYADVLGVAVSGLFDGLRYEAALSPGTLNIGLYYTGLLYKETAKILMTPSDIISYGDPRDLEELKDYFASRRLFIAGRWNMPLGETNDLSFEALAQFDFNGKDDKLHSQYGELQLEFFTQSKIGLTAGAFFEAMEMVNIGNEDDIGVAFGALGILRMNLPTPINDGLKLSAKFSSGSWNDTVTAFVPLSGHAQGQIFPETFSGLGVAKLNYEARILQSLFADAAFSYFIRTDSEFDSDDYLYGGEAWVSLAWQPLDDIRLNLGGGVFFPGMGNIYPDDTDLMWKISAGLTLSF